MQPEKNLVSVGAEGRTRVTVIRPADRTHETVQTPGMTREEAIRTSSQWAGYVRTAAGMTSGWHHHSDYNSTLYVLTGTVRIESGVAGQDTVEAHPGDFIFIPKGMIHRESNPSTEQTDIIVLRFGTGVPVVNVDGPETVH